MKKKFSLVILTMVTVMSVIGCSSENAPTITTTQIAETEKNEAKTIGQASTDWPSKSAITLMVPAKAGGGSDIQARNLATPWQKALGQSIAVVNYENAEVGAQEAAKAKIDGYSIFSTHSGGYVRYITGMSEVNPLEKYRVVASISDSADQAIVAHPSAPYNNMTEFVEYCKVNPDEVTWGVSINGTSHFIAGKVCAATGIEPQFVEASSETDKLTNVAGGFIDIGNVSIANAVQYEQSGKLKVLGIVGGTDKEEYMKNGESWAILPTQGIDATWEGRGFLYVPADTPDEVCEAINLSLKPIYEDAGFVEGLKNLGSTATYLGVKEAQAAFEEECTTINEVGEFLGLKQR